MSSYEIVSDSFLSCCPGEAFFLRTDTFDIQTHDTLLLGFMAATLLCENSPSCGVFWLSCNPHDLSHLHTYCLAKCHPSFIDLPGFLIFLFCSASRDLGCCKSPPHASLLFVRFATVVIKASMWLCPPTHDLKGVMTLCFVVKGLSSFPPFNSLWCLDQIEIRPCRHIIHTHMILVFTDDSIRSQVFLWNDRQVWRQNIGPCLPRNLSVLWAWCALHDTSRTVAVVQDLRCTCINDTWKNCCLNFPPSICVLREAECHVKPLFIFVILYYVQSN